MLNNVHGALNKIPLWTQDDAIAFECAQETIGHMMAICSYLLQEEKTKTLPNLKRMNELLKKRAFFADERRNLHLDDKDNIERIRKEYGKKIKTYECYSGECPV